MMTKAGIDNLIFNMDFKKISTSVNFKILETLNVTYTNNEKNTVKIYDKETGEIKEFSKMIIKEPVSGVTQIVFGTKKLKSGTVYFIHVYTNFPTLLFGNNQKNINNGSDFIKAISMINDLINKSELFRIPLNFYDLEINTIEINKNLKIDNFTKYKKAIDLINRATTKKLNQSKSFGLNNSYTGFSAKNNSTELKFYDKYEQSKNKKILCEEYIMRVEITKKSFHKRINNTFTQILKESTFEEFVESTFIDSANSIFGNNIKELLNSQVSDTKLIFQNDNSLKKNYSKAIFQGNEVFDIIIPLYAMKSFTDNKNYTKIARNQIKLVEQTRNKYVLFGNIEKLNYILKSLGLEPIYFELSNVIENELKQLYKPINSLKVS